MVKEDSDRNGGKTSKKMGIHLMERMPVFKFCFPTIYTVLVIISYREVYNETQQQYLFPEIMTHTLTCSDKVGAIFIVYHCTERKVHLLRPVLRTG